jgi:hypothetical protein
MRVADDQDCQLPASAALLLGTDAIEKPVCGDIAR